jgi:hypothetical protein
MLSPGALQRDIGNAAAILHAEGTMMLELARAAAAFVVASRDSSASPFLGLTAYHLRSDGNAPASTTPAGISGRPAATDRRNAIFVNGRPEFGPPPALSTQGQQVSMLILMLFCSQQNSGGMLG